MLLNTTIRILRAARDTLTTMIDLAESFRDSDHGHPPGPPQSSTTEGLTWSSVHGPVGPVRGFGSVHGKPR